MPSRSRINNPTGVRYLPLAYLCASCCTFSFRKGEEKKKPRWGLCARRLAVNRPKQSLGLDASCFFSPTVLKSLVIITFVALISIWYYLCVCVSVQSWKMSKYFSIKICWRPSAFFSSWDSLCNRERRQTLRNNLRKYLLFRVAIPQYYCVESPWTR